MYSRVYFTNINTPSFTIMIFMNNYIQFNIFFFQVFYMGSKVFFLSLVQLPIYFIIYSLSIFTYEFVIPILYNSIQTLYIKNPQYHPQVPNVSSIWRDSLLFVSTLHLQYLIYIFASLLGQIPYPHNS